MTRLKGIKAVSFDVDGTLWDFETVMRNALREALRELARHDAPAAAMLDVEKMIAIRDRVHEELRGKTSDLVEIRKESFKQMLRDVGRPNDALGLHLGELYLKHRWANAERFEDVRPTMEALAPKYVLGMLSNGNSYPDQIGLGDLVSFAVYAQDHGGIEKPDTRLFEVALERAGCSAEELLHVGGSLETDVMGATRAGVKSVWLNRNGHGACPDIAAVAEIASLRELLEIL